MMGFFIRKQESPTVNRRMESASRVGDVRERENMIQPWMRRIFFGGASMTINSNDSGRD